MGSLMTTALIYVTRTFRFWQLFTKYKTDFLVVYVRFVDSLYILYTRYIEKQRVHYMCINPLEPPSLWGFIFVLTTVRKRAVLNPDQVPIYILRFNSQMRRDVLETLVRGLWGKGLGLQKKKKTFKARPSSHPCRDLEFKILRCLVLLLP